MSSLSRTTLSSNESARSTRNDTNGRLSVRVRTVVLAAVTILTLARLVVATLDADLTLASAFLTLLALGAAIALLVSRRRPEAFIALLLLWLPEAGIVGGEPGPWSLLSVLGLPTSPGGPVATVGGVSVAVAAVAVAPLVAWKDRTLVAPSVSRLFLPWGVALFFGCWAALLGLVAGHEAWSLGLRLPLTVGVLFWGARFASVAGEARWLRPVTTGAALLVLLGALGGHLMFLAAGLCAAVATSRTSSIPLSVRLLAASAAGIAAMATLTTAGIVLVAGGMSLLPSLSGRRTPSVAVAIVLSAVGIAVSLVGIGATSAGDQSESIWVAESVFGGEERLVTSKLLLDRGPLWAAAVADVRTSNPIVVPSGRPLLVQDYPVPGVTQEWTNGAHNSALEALRQLGPVGAAALMFVVVLTAVQLARVVWRDRAGSATAILGAASLGVLIVGTTTGQFPITESVGFVLWAAIGLAIGSERCRAIAPDGGRTPRSVTPRAG